MSEWDIEQCIQAVVNGNLDAFEYIVKAYQVKLVKYIKYIAPNNFEVDDLVQEVFIKAYINLHQYKKQTNFNAWLYKLAYNHTKSKLRKMAKEPLVKGGGLDEAIHLDKYSIEESREVYQTL